MDSTFCDLLASRIAGFAGLHHCTGTAAVAAATCRDWRKALNPHVRYQASLQFHNAVQHNRQETYPISPAYDEWGEVATYVCCDCRDRVWNECDTINMMRCMHCLCKMWREERELERRVHAVTVIQQAWARNPWARYRWKPLPSEQ